MNGGHAGSGGPPIGRSNEVAAVRRALGAADVVVVHGVAGIGKSTVVRAALAGERPVWIRCLPALTRRSYGAMAAVAGGPSPGAHAGRIDRWLVDRVPSGVLVVEDLQFADRDTAALVAAVAGELTCVVVVRGDAATVEAATAALFAGRTVAFVPIGPLSGDAGTRLAIEHGADAASAAALATHTGGHPYWIIHEARGDHGASAARSVAATLDRAEVGVRTVVVALAVLGRPARRRLLGAAVGVAERDGLVIPMPGGDTVALAHALVGEVALARVTPEDRRAVHRALAPRLRSPLERARHFAAGGDREQAIVAARTATGTDVAALEALELLVELTGDDADRARLADAALRSGRHDVVVALADGVGIGSPHRPALVAAAATACRSLGRDPRPWLAIADDLLGPADPADATHRALAIERFLVAAPSERIAGHELVAMCAGTPDEPMACVAVAVAGITAGASTWEEELRAAIATAARAGHAAAELAGLWAYVTAAAAGGALTTATELACSGAARADELGQHLWAARFGAEQAWCASVAASDLPDGAVAGAIALRLGDGGELGAARRLLAGGPGSRRDAAVALALDWYDDACDPVAVQQLLGTRRDPIVTWIAGPVAAWTGGLDADAPSVIRAEARAVSALGDDPARAIDLFLDAGRRWAASTGRGEARAAWAAARSAVVVGDVRATALIEQAVEVVERTGVRALDHRLADVARRAGVPHERGRDRVRVITPREAEVLECVAEGLSTARIARRLGIAPTTVATHLRSAAMKLGAANRREAAAILARTRATSA